MIKKIIALGVLLVMAFSFTACEQINELAAYKADAKTSLEAYATAKGQENYYEEDWEAISGFVTWGKAAVDAATDKAGVDLAVLAAKQAIDEVQTKEDSMQEGSFYSLEEAFNQGWITQTQLKSIAYYYHGESDDESFVPTPKNPEALNEAMENNIKQLYLDTLNIPQSLIDAYPNGVHLLDYYGTYSNSIVLKIEDSYIPKDLPPITDYVVGGVVFKQYYYNVYVLYLSLN